MLMIVVLVAGGLGVACGGKASADQKACEVFDEIRQQTLDGVLIEASVQPQLRAMYELTRSNPDSMVARGAARSLRAVVADEFDPDELKAGMRALQRGCTAVHKGGAGQDDGCDTSEWGCVVHP